MPTKTNRSISTTARLESGRFMERRDLVLLLFAWLISSVVLIAVDQGCLWMSREKAFKYREGDSITADYIVSKDFSFIDEEATSKAVALNRSLVSPVYEVRSEITDSVLNRWDRFSTYLRNAANGREVSESMRNEFPGISSLVDRESPRSPEQLGLLLDTTREVLQSLLFAGVFRLDNEDGGAASGLIEVVYGDLFPEQRVSLIRNAATTVEDLPERVRTSRSLSEFTDDDVEFVLALVTFFIEPNTYQNVLLSEERRAFAEASTEPVVLSITAETRLLSAGDVVTGAQARILEALRESGNVGYHGFFDPLFYMAVLLILGMVAGRIFGITIDHAKTFRLYAVLGGSYLLMAAVMIAFGRFGNEATVSLALPTALYTLLLANLLQDRRLAVLSSFLMAVLVYFLTGLNGHDFLITIAAGVGGVLAVKRQETRVGLLRAGPRLAATIALFTLLSGILVRLSVRTSLIMAAWGAVNGFITGLLSLALLPLLEHLLNTATRFRLIELSDHNVPILKRMRLQAPGTYIHSQNVAHLAEAACDAIGADGLLARVGAYYHDIGKVDQAHFFVENQKGDNRNNKIKARLSSAVIKSHVKIGMEKGRAFRLPDEVLAVIEQHHGTSVIRYFYDRAMKETLDDSVSREDFSYGGPKPRSREAAVVMLADSAEAATRTLKKPTAAKLEKYVWDLIMERFRTGELNESDLTLRDLGTIKQTFVHVLTGHFHTRIEYPKDDTEKA